MKHLDKYVNVKQAISASNYAAGVMTAIPINTTGFGRARFVFAFGPGGETASISTNAYIYCGTGSATMNVSMPTAKLAAITSGALSGGNYIAIIDTAVSDGYPWLCVSSLSVLSTAIVLSCQVTLYDGTRSYPPTQTPTQVVVV